MLAAPSFGAATAVAPHGTLSPAAAPAPATRPRPPRLPPIDINSATRAQLRTLPGITDADAQRIIEHRPYHSKGQLVTAKVIPAGIYQLNRHRIIAIQPGPPPPRRHP
jgi:competence protein ComEA